MEIPEMNMVAALIGFSSFVLVLTAIGVIGLWKADRLESWVKRKLGKRDKISL